MLFPILKVGSWSYRCLAAWGASDARYPLCWCIYGHLEGHGWGFLNPWERQAIFPEAGTTAGVGHKHRIHEPFAIARVFPTWRTERHPLQEDPVTGRFWWGLAWRRSWDKPRVVLLDPDRIGRRGERHMPKLGLRRQRRHMLPVPDSYREKLGLEVVKKLEDHGRKS
jgi:hypothetical protein